MLADAIDGARRGAAVDLEGLLRLLVRFVDRRAAVDGGIDAMSGDTSARPGDLSPCDEGMRRMTASPLVTGVFWGEGRRGRRRPASNTR